MTAEVGLAALWLAAAFAALQLALAALALGRAGVREGGEQLSGAVGSVAIVQGLLAAVATILLVRAFLISDMSIQLVVRTSPAGAVLLWLAMLGLAGGLVARGEQRPAERASIAALGLQAAVALGCYGWLLFAANPFARVAVASLDGNGLAPSARGGGAMLALPALDAGYAALAVAASVVLGARLAHDGSRDRVRVWCRLLLGGWVLLTLSMTIVSYTTYLRPGEGGWWPWRPADVVALSAWLVATALLYAVTPLATGSGPRAWLGGGRPVPVSVWGLVVAHLGAAVTLTGIIAVSALGIDRAVAAGTGEPQQIGPYTVTLDGIRPTIGPNWSALEAHLTARRGDGPPVVLRPQSRHFVAPPASTSEYAVAVDWDGRLATALGRPRGGGRWQLRLEWAPFASLIWLGGVLMTLGGGVALGGRLQHDRRRRERDHWA